MRPRRHGALAVLLALALWLVPQAAAAAPAGPPPIDAKAWTVIDGRSGEEQIEDVSRAYSRLAQAAPNEIDDAAATVRDIVYAMEAAATAHPTTTRRPPPRSMLQSTGTESSAA